MKKLVAVVLFVVLLFAFASMSFAKGPGNCSKMGMGGGMAERPMMGPQMVLAMASELNLTTEQMTTLKKITDDCAEKCTMKKDKDMEAMDAEMHKDAPDETKINALIDKIADAHKTEMKQMTKSMLAVQAVLTKEQKQILKKKMDENKDQMGMRMGKMKGMDR